MKKVTVRSLPAKGFTRVGACGRMWPGEGTVVYLGSDEVDSVAPDGALVIGKTSQKILEGDSRFVVLPGDGVIRSLDEMAARIAELEAALAEATAKKPAK